jgi:small-conductance mechanosensitive channel
MDLSTVYYRNSLGAWLTAAGIALGAAVLFLLIRHFAVARLEALSKRTKNDWDDLAVRLLRRTRAYFLFFLGVRIAAEFLVLPAEARRGLRLATVILVLVQGAVWGNGLITFWTDRLTAQRQALADGGSVMTIRLLGFAARLLLWSIIALMALANLGVDVTALVAGLGIGGIAIALAVQNILGDLFGALSIMLDKPFVVGDFIIVDNYMGTVENVGIKTTRLRSLSGEQLIISNSDLLKARIRNFRRMWERRVVFTIGVTYGTPHATLARVPDMLRGIIESQEKTRVDRVHFFRFGDSSLDFEVVYYVASPDYNVYMDIQQAINLELVRRFEAEGIEFAFPTRTIHVASVPSDASGAALTNSDIR